MMRIRERYFALLAAAVVTGAASSASAQALYTQNFDVDDSANWTVNNGPGDEAHDFFFDYSTVGVPAAPNSGGTTRGMKLQANLLPPGVFTGMSVSPNGQSFTGDYVVKFDLWHNYIGTDGSGIGVVGGATGSSMLSTFGVMTNGTTPNWPGTGDGVWFGAIGDGQSTSDYRAYSAERQVSYQLPTVTPEDSHATYFAGSRNSSATLYTTNFGGATVPAAQTALYPETQFGVTQPGAIGFEWYEATITKEGNLVTWALNGIDLISVDTTNFATAPTGTNILFGHADISAGNSSDPYFPFVQFTLIDNVRVESLSVAPVEDADFDEDGDVDGADFLTWQRGLGINDGSADLADGDANADGNVTAADLTIWRDQFGPGAPVSVVPEPATWALAALAAAVCMVAALPRRRLALAGKPARR